MLLCGEVLVVPILPGLHREALHNALARSMNAYLSRQVLLCDEVMPFLQELFWEELYNALAVWYLSRYC